MKKIFLSLIPSLISFLILLIFIAVILGCAEQAEEAGQKSEAGEPGQIAEDIKEDDNLIEEEIKTGEKPVIEETRKVDIPSSVISSKFGFLAGSPYEAETAALAGAAWLRPHPGPFVWGYVEEEKNLFNFGNADQWVKKAQKVNITILATVWPYAEWDQKKCHAQECEVSPEDIFYPKEFGEVIPKSRCKPCLMDDYRSFLSKLVERYDGDGISDMPGLEIPLRYYEISNEPEMEQPSLTFYKGTLEEYVEILKESYTAVKAACPDCVVVQGGAAGATSNSLNYWRETFRLGGDNYFDIANIHFVNFGDLATLNVKDFKKLMQEENVNKPLWVTEAEYESEAGVESSVDGALEAGASRIFFTRFEIGKQGPPAGGKYSLIYDKVIKRD